MDNGTSEYVFVTTFFAPEPDLPPVQTPQVVSSHLFSPTVLPTPLPADDAVSSPASDVAPVTPRPRERTDSVFSNESLHPASRLSKEDLAALNAVWKQIMDPALEHAKVGISPFPLCLIIIIYFLLTRERRPSYKPHWNPRRL
jgi:vacuolar protein sorting-associated protein 52